DEPVGSSLEANYKQRLWVFHGNGVSVYSAGCGGLLHQVDGRDIIPQNGLALCGGTQSESGLFCKWSENAIISDQKIYIGQPKLNRIIVFDSQQLNVAQVIATDPQPMKLWLIRSQTEDQIWVLCHGESDANRKQRETSHSSFTFEDSESGSREFDWNSPSFEQKRHNKKTVQVVRILPNSRAQNVIHLQPIDGHFDLVYDLFVPTPSPLQRHHIHNNRFAYVTHWDERALIKIDMEQFKYIKTINLAECQPINAVFTEFGLLIVQCQTPVTHQLNGKSQLVVDEITDTIISYNAHIKSHKSYLSPNQHFLVNIFHNTSALSPISTTIIVQKVTQSGLQFLYDVRTTLTIVNCDFVWKNGNYDAILASGTANREDLLYLSLIDGRVELISGIGRPTKGNFRGMAVSKATNLGAITSLESVFVLDLNSNRVQCETQQRHEQPETLVWT
ncbi:follistatin-related protein 5-like protein, partial [Leptotrombidium deliense]